MKKVYIAGKITGMEEKAFELFGEAEKILTEQGFEVVNPMKLPHDHDKSWESYMRETLIAMLGCDTMFMLSNYYKSKGALLEHSLAKDLKMQIIYQ